MVYSLFARKYNTEVAKHAFKKFGMARGNTSNMNMFTKPSFTPEGPKELMDGIAKPTMLAPYLAGSFLAYVCGFWMASRAYHEWGLTTGLKFFD